MVVSPHLTAHCIFLLTSSLSLSHPPDFHKPAKKASHVRKARFSTAIADILRKCEKEGKVSDYGGSKPEGKNILKYVLEYEDGQETYTHSHARTHMHTHNNK